MESQSFDVTALQSRPAFLPSPFVLGRNNLNPRLSLDNEGVTIKVVTETKVEYSEIQELETKEGLGGKKYLTLDCGGWTYVAHFAEEKELHRLLDALKGRGVG